MRITDGLSNVCDLSVVAVTASGGGGITQIDKLIHSNGNSGDQFGVDVDISKDGTAVAIGARYDNANAGTMHVFEKASNGTWSQKGAVLAFPSGQMNLSAVALDASGEYVAAGSTYGGGKVRVWRWGGSAWGTPTVVVANLANSSSATSLSLNSSGDTLVVGDAGYDSYKGRIFIYTRSGYTTWTQTQVIYPPSGRAVPYGRFGWDGIHWSTDGSKFTLAHRSSGAALGRAYIYKYVSGAWALEHTFAAPSTSSATDTYTGNACDTNADGTMFIMGARDWDGWEGAAFIYTYSSGSWSSGVEIKASDYGTYATNTGGFGACVSMSDDGNDVLVGGAGSTGAIYHFKYESGAWVQKEKWQPSDIAANNQVGNQQDEEQHMQIASDGTFIVGVKGAAGGGAAYICSIPGTAVAASISLVASLPIKADGTVLSFTGQHICVPSEPMTQGLVVSANKNKYFNLNGALTTGVGAIRSSESIPMVSLSNVANDRSVFGVVDKIESGISTIRKTVLGPIMITSEKELGDNRVIVNSLGEGAIQVVNTNGPLVSGDYMTTSNITGYSQKQDDDILHNYTVAKITMDCDFEPDDVPVQVIKKKDTGDNDLDVYGRIQWEDHPSNLTQKAYTIGYLTADGTPTDEANVVHRTAYVGCTYHCG
jgi:hypothetical protein